MVESKVKSTSTFQIRNTAEPRYRSPKGGAVNLDSLQRIGADANLAPDNIFGLSSKTDHKLRHSSNSSRRHPVRRSLQYSKIRSQNKIKNLASDLSPFDLNNIMKPIKNINHNSRVFEESKTLKPETPSSASIRRKPTLIEDAPKKEDNKTNTSKKGKRLLDRKKIEISESNAEKLKKKRNSRLRQYKKTKQSKTPRKILDEISKARKDMQEKYSKQNTMSLTPDLRTKKPRENPKGGLVRAQSSEMGKSRFVNGGKLEIPYIKAPVRNRKYTLVLDLDETLIHFKNIPGRSKFLIRPHCYKFLQNLHPQFEIIIFTAAQQQYADWIIDKIDLKVE